MILLERGHALAVLDDLLAEASAGRGRMALVRGEAGIGKTALVRQFVGQIDTAHILWGGCDDLLTARPLGPLWDMAYDDAGLEAALGEDDRHVTFSTVLDLLSRSLRPTVMVIEDVHWADEATLDLIKFIGRRIERTHGLLLLTYRDGDVQGDHPLRVSLGDLPYGVVERIPLQPLTPEGVSVIAGDRDGAAIWELTRGNPFFVSEVVTAGGETVPLSIKDALRARVQRLSESARAVVELAAVAPGRIEISLVTVVLGESAEPIAESEGAGIIEVEGDSLSFRHELARRAIEGDLPEIERRRLNLACLQAAEELGLDIARCAHHAREAGDADAILRILPAAARRAADFESHSEAVSHLRALRPYLDAMTPEQLADHYDLWAWEEYLSTEAGSELIDKAVEVRRGLGDAEALGNSLLAASRIAWVSGRRNEAIARGEEAVEVLSPVGGKSLAMAYSTLSQLAMLGNEEEKTLALADKVFSLLDEGPSEVRAHSLNNVGSIKMNNRYPEGVAELEESYRMSRDLGLSHEAARACVNLAWGYLYIRELDTALPWIDRGLEIASGAEMSTFESYAWTEKAMWHEYRGEWDLAEGIAREVQERATTQATSRATSTVTLAKVLARRGDPEASVHVVAAMELAEKSGEIQRMAPAASVVVEYHWLGGDVPDRLLSRAIEIEDDCFRLGATWMGGELGQWLHIAGLSTDSLDQAPEPYRLLTRGDWAAAASWWESHAIPYSHAVALSAGDDDARVQALAILDQLDAIPFASRLRSELQAKGVKGVPRGPQRATRDNPLGLTARQTDVLTLLTDDLTNAEIADRLFISTRTVDHHVSAILAKLGATSRSEAAEMAREVLAAV